MTTLWWEAFGLEAEAKRSRQEDEEATDKLAT
jgi:hypothetical protein